MRLELQSAANFLVHVLRLRRLGISEAQLSKFNRCLIEEMRKRYRDFWFPERPLKCSGYRQINFNGREEVITARAGKSAGIKSDILNQAWQNIMMWIDPLEVCYRIGEHGSICVLYEYYPNRLLPWSPIPRVAHDEKNKDCFKCKRFFQQGYVKWVSFLKIMPKYKRL
jgi:protein Tob/BTG